MAQAAAEARSAEQGDRGEEDTRRETQGGKRGWKKSEAGSRAESASAFDAHRVHETRREMNLLQKFVDSHAGPSSTTRILG